MPGCRLELDALKPIAMSPDWSMAMLGIQRNVASGANVPCWKIVGDPPLSRSSYQRTATEEPLVTLCAATSASWSPKFRYASRYMSRSPSESSCCDVPDCGMQVPLLPQASLKEFTASVLGPVNVELAGVVKSTWNWNAASVFALAPSERSVLGSPAGGSMLPSRSAGRRLETLVGALNEMLVAVWPASMAERSSAATLVPRKAVPAALNWLTVR